MHSLLLEESDIRQGDGFSNFRQPSDWFNTFETSALVHDHLPRFLQQVLTVSDDTARLTNYDKSWLGRREDFDIATSELLPLRLSLKFCHQERCHERIELQQTKARTSADKN